MGYRLGYGLVLFPLQGNVGLCRESDFPNEMDNFKVVLHPEDSERVWAMVNMHLRDQVGYEVEYRLRTKSGEYRWFSGRGLAIRDPDGLALSYVRFYSRHPRPQTSGGSRPPP